MSPSLRAFFGALFGALLVLLVHPASRPYMTSGLWFLGGSEYLRESNARTEEMGPLPEPDSLETSALWLVVACEQHNTLDSLTPDKYLLLIEVAQQASDQDTENAFWYQVEAAFQWELGNRDAARRAWHSASLSTRWDDYQAQRLGRVVDGLRREAGQRLAWHYALATSRKSSSAGQAILAFGRTIRAEPSQADDLELKFDTLVNGALLREGGRMYATSEYGLQLVNAAVVDPLTLGPPLARQDLVTPREVLLLREQFISELSDRGETSKATLATNEFKRVDAWQAWIEVQDVDRTRRNLTVASILTSAGSGALLAVGLLSALMLLATILLERTGLLRALLQPPIAPILGVVVGGLVFYSTGLIFPAIWAAVALASFSFKHDSANRQIAQKTGRPFGLIVTGLAVLFAAVSTIFVVGLSTPARYLGKTTSFPDFAGPGSPLLADLAGLSAMIVSLVLVTAPVWGYIRRVEPHVLAPIAIKRFFLASCLGCLTLGVIIMPISIRVDHSLADTLEKVLQNEPGYYLTR
ncbi:MAG: hypothetical protein IH944_02390 [Armatimonadetes bacterium]|nr:hypothetical protein [Armatimonadota bacterium]